MLVYNRTRRSRWKGKDTALACIIYRRNPEPQHLLLDGADDDADGSLSGFVRCLSDEEVTKKTAC